MNLAVARRRPTVQKYKVLEVRPLVPADLENLRQKSARVRIQKIKESHHHIARLAASGVANRDIAARVGYHENTVCTLLSDPSMIELIATYRAEVNASWRESVDSMHELATQNMLIAERQLSESLEAADAAGEPLPARVLLAITSDRMDRFGYGKHQTSTNINVGFAAKLESAITKARTLTLSRKVATE